MFSVRLKQKLHYYDIIVSQWQHAWTSLNQDYTNHQTCELSVSLSAKREPLLKSTPIFDKSQLFLSFTHALVIGIIFLVVIIIFFRLCCSITRQFLFFHFSERFHFFQAHTSPSSPFPQLCNFGSLVGKSMSRFTLQILEETFQSFCRTWALFRRVAMRRCKRSRLFQCWTCLPREKIVSGWMLGSFLGRMSWRALHCCFSFHPKLLVDWRGQNLLNENNIQQTNNTTSMGHKTLCQPRSKFEFLRTWAHSNDKKSFLSLKHFLNNGLILKTKIRSDYKWLRAALIVLFKLNWIETVGSCQNLDHKLVICSKC